MRRSNRNYTARFPDTIEFGLKAWVDGYLVVNFDYSPADPSVGMGERANEIAAREEAATLAAQERP